VLLPLPGARKGWAARKATGRTGRCSTQGLAGASQDRHEHERGKRGDRMPSGVAARATDSWSITDTSPQPLLAPSAAVDPANQPIPGAQPTCAHTHQGQGQEKFTTPILRRCVRLIHVRRPRLTYIGSPATSRRTQPTPPKVLGSSVGGCAPLFLANSSLAKGRPAGRLPLRCGRIARRHTRRDPGADTHGVRHLPYPHP
jgi:hypothetical protein